MWTHFLDNTRDSVVSGYNHRCTLCRLLESRMATGVSVRERATFQASCQIKLRDSKLPQADARGADIMIVLSEDLKNISAQAK